jgi:hypothetical protein
MQTKQNYSQLGTHPLIQLFSVIKCYIFVHNFQKKLFVY